MFKYNIFFMMVSCGYMSSWTAIGSLIPYFKAHYGADFYVKIYCAYYLPGLVVSLLQQRYDSYFDAKYGSWRSYMARMCGSFLLVACMVLVLPFLPDIPDLRICVMAVIGAFSWLMHGTACMLVAMFPPAATAYLQTGFRCPEIFTVAIVIALELESEEPTHFALVSFHVATALLLITGMIGFVGIMLGKPAQQYLAAKDQSNEASRMEIVPLVPSKRGGGGPSQRLVPSPGGQSTGADRVAALRKQLAKESGLAPGYQGAGEEDRGYIAHAIHECRVALYLTMFSSIFTAAFFAYVTSSDGNDIEQVLYFTRLFCDLLGRPLTRLPRPQGIRQPGQLMWWSVARLALAVLFFAYIVVPGFPQNDTFITFVVGIFSVGSGYLSVLAYEYAALQVRSKAAQAMAATLMNTTFQYAAFSSVLSGVAIAETGLITYDSY